MTLTPNHVPQLVYVVDDDDLVRETLISILESLSYEVQAFNDGISFLQSVEKLNQGAVLLDVNMPKLNGLQVLHSLLEQGFNGPVIVMSGQADIGMAVEAMKLGALDFIEKPFSVGTVAKTLEDSLSRFERQAPAASTTELNKAIEEKLSVREMEVLRNLVSGQPNKIVARKLNISHRTVEVHRANIMRQLDANSFAELVRIAISHGIDGE